MTFEDAPYYHPPYDQEQQQCMVDVDTGRGELLWIDATRIHAVANEIRQKAPRPLPGQAPRAPVVATKPPPIRRREPEKAQGSPSGSPVAFRLF